MIIRVFSVITGLCFIIVFGVMIFIGQDGLLSQLCGIMTGLLFFVYGILGPNKMGKYLPGMVKKIG
ncbi:hypothetical protein SIN8267_02679 [Sinobacterium norvegicum]|uniref:Uncharacterized protein n=1 Tax=Sinobacterium norvegicum TaxID=1641715 RepID=A0ABN8EQK5_9GAMM|nr:hypothetical protein SIN8267_02679 [Sinobacterium norvegicum]